MKKKIIFNDFYFFRSQILKCSVNKSWDGGWDFLNEMVGVHQIRKKKWQSDFFIWSRRGSVLLLREGGGCISQWTEGNIPSLSPVACNWLTDHAGSPIIENTDRLHNMWSQTWLVLWYFIYLCENFSVKCNIKWLIF